MQASYGDARTIYKYDLADQVGTTEEMRGVHWHGRAYAPFAE